MAKPKNRSRRRKKTGIGRGLGFIVVILLFICSAFLFTCQRNHTANVSRVKEEKPSLNIVPRETARSNHKASHVNKPVIEPVAKKVNNSDTVEMKTEKPAVSLSSPSPSEQEADIAPDSTKKSDVEKIPLPSKHESGHEYSRGSASSSRIALTFDAGASAKPAAKILDILSKHRVHATFFLTGKWMEKNPGLTRRIIAEGNEIGNHTYSHKRLTDLSTGDIIQEIDKTEQLAIDLTGHSTKPLLRVPFGARDKQVLSVLADQGYESIYWDFDCWDSVKTDITSQQIEDRVLEKIRKGSIVLMHCGSQATADALDSLLNKLSEDRYEQVTVSQLFGG